MIYKAFLCVGAITIIAGLVVFFVYLGKLMLKTTKVKDLVKLVEVFTKLITTGIIWSLIVGLIYLISLLLNLFHIQMINFLALTIFVVIFFKLIEVVKAEAKEAKEYQGNAS